MQLPPLQGRERIEEEDLYAAMENKAIEAYSEMTGSPKPGQVSVHYFIPSSLPMPWPAPARDVLPVPLLIRLPPPSSSF